MRSPPMLSTMLVSGATVVATLSLPSWAVKLSSVPASPAPGLAELDEQLVSTQSASRTGNASSHAVRRGRRRSAADIGGHRTGRSALAAAARHSHYTV